MRPRVVGDTATDITASSTRGGGCGVEWTTPSAGRSRVVSLRIHADASLGLLAAGIGHMTGDTLRGQYAQQFDRVRTTESVPMDAAIRAERPRVGRPGHPSVVHRDEAVSPRPVPREASAPTKRTLFQRARGRMRTCEPWLRRSRPRGSAVNCLERNRAGYGVWVGPSCGRFPGILRRRRRTVDARARRNTIQEMTPNTTNSKNVIRETTQMTSNRVARHPSEFWTSASTQSPTTATASSIQVRRLKNIGRR
jgi:hypothetical protein